MSDTEHVDSPAQPEEPVKLNYIRLNAPPSYANATNIGVSVYEVRLMFAVTEPAAGGVANVREVANIVLSPQHAKGFAFILLQKMEEYEKQFGPLPSLETLMSGSIVANPSSIEPEQPS